MKPDARPILMLGAFLGIAACGSEDRVAGEESFQARRAAFQTTLTRHGPSPVAPDTLSDLRAVFGDDLAGTLERVTYPGPLGSMRAWLYLPPDAGEDPGPALLFLHAGFRLIPDQQSYLSPFMDAGYVVMWPTNRGEHGNPGFHELFFGEVDDAAAAARWLAGRPSVDPDRVYALGWSAGGGAAAMLSLWEDVPLRHTASSGGLYHPDFLRRPPESLGPGGSGSGSPRPPPFDTTDAAELAMRTLPGNFRWMKRPHYAFIETESEAWIRSIAAADQARRRGDTLIEVIMVPGDHFSIFPEVVRRYLDLIEEETH